MKASYYTDPVRGKVYRRSYDTLEEAKAYRDEFYAWYQAEVPAPDAHLIKDGEGWAVELTSAEGAALLRKLWADIQSENPEKVRDLRFFWTHKKYTNYDDFDNGVEREGIFYALGFLWKDFYNDSVRWQPIVSDIYDAWRGPNHVPSQSDREHCEQVLISCFHDGMSRHKLHPSEVDLGAEA